MYFYCSTSFSKYANCEEFSFDNNQKWKKQGSGIMNQTQKNKEWNQIQVYIYIFLNIIIKKNNVNPLSVECASDHQYLIKNKN